MDRGSGSRAAPRKSSTALRTLVGAAVAVALAVTVGGHAVASPPPPPDPTDAELQQAGDEVTAQLGAVGDLVDQVVTMTGQLQQLEDQIAIRREDANKALVDLQNARDQQDAAADAVTQSRAALDVAGQQIADAQGRFDSYVAMSYTQGNVGAASVASYLGSESPDEVLQRAQVVELVSRSQQRVLDDLQRARTEQANRDSLARQAKLDADAAAADALAKRDEAVDAIAAAESAYADQQAQRTELEALRDAAQARLEEARRNVAGLNAQRDAAQLAQQQAAQQAAASEQAGGEPADVSAATPDVALPDLALPDLALPEIALPEVALPGLIDRSMVAAPIAGNQDAILAALQTAEQLALGALQRLSTNQGQRDRATELGEGRRPHTDLDDSPSTQRRSGTRSTPSVTGAQAIEIVVDRAMSQLGVPYAWGGGDENGPTRGIRDGGVGDSYGDYRKVGFDCSGLMIYAFAGVGIELEHYSGYQYTAGRQVPVSQMRRGDMLFWGAGGGQHVALYLGGGAMIEAPESGGAVQVTEVREDGMMPYATRLIT